MELLCVISIIAILATLLLGAVGRAYARAKRMKREIETPALYERFHDRLAQFCQAHAYYPPLTASQLHEIGVFDSTIMDFLRSKGVVFRPFASTNSDDMVILEINGHETFRKGDLKPRSD